MQCKQVFILAEMYAGPYERQTHHTTRAPAISTVHSTGTHKVVKALGGLLPHLQQVRGFSVPLAAASFYDLGYSIIS